MCCAPSSITDRGDKVRPNTDSWASPLMPQDQFLRVILKLATYCNVLEKSSLYSVQGTNYRAGVMKKANQNKTKTTLCLCANLPCACSLDTACASDSTSPEKTWGRCWASGRDGKRDKDGVVSV